MFAVSRPESLQSEVEMYEALFDYRIDLNEVNPMHRSFIDDFIRCIKAEILQGSDLLSPELTSHWLKFTCDDLTVVAGNFPDVLFIQQLCEVLRQPVRNQIATAIDYNNYEIVAFLRLQEPELQTAISAALSGCADAILNLHEIKCSLDTDIAVQAALHGHLHGLQFVAVADCDRFPQVCAAAAGNGHLDCLKYAHENGWPWDLTTTKAAADGGKVDCLTYALKNGCPGDESVCLEAAREDHLSCLQAVVEHGCPLLPGTRLQDTCTQNNSPLCSTYALEHTDAARASRFKLADVCNDEQTSCHNDLLTAALSLTIEDYLPPAAVNTSSRPVSPKTRRAVRQVTVDRGLCSAGAVNPARKGRKWYGTGWMIVGAAVAAASVVLLVGMRQRR